MTHNTSVTNIYIKKSGLSNCDGLCKFQSNDIIFLKTHYQCIYFLEILCWKSSDRSFKTIDLISHIQANIIAENNKKEVSGLKYVELWKSFSQETIGLLCNNK